MLLKGSCFSKSLVITLASVLFLSLLSACGSDSDNDTSFGGGDGTPVRENLPVEKLPTEDDIIQNPIATSTQFFGQNGNLYKPSGDDHGAGGGNLVVLFSSSYKKRFDSCAIRLNTGEVAHLTCIDNQPWTQIPYSCFSNGNRQTWRADFKCSSAGEVRVVCKDATQEVTFTVPEAQRGNVCSRFG